MTKQQQVSLASIQNAHARISTIVPPTPTAKSLFHSALYAKNIHLKLENFNISGSFKIRGAANALLAAAADIEQVKHGVVAASAGNHAQGVAHVCKKLGIAARIFMPVGTPMIKVESTKGLGAEVVLVGETYDDAYHEALIYEKESKAMMIHPFANPDVISGQGTIALELFEQVKNIGMVIVPIGGGGLIGGIACAIKESHPEIKVIGVQAAAYPAMKRSVELGQPVQGKPASTIADGIAVKNVHPLNFGLVQKYVDDIILVEEEEIAAAIMDLMERNHTVAEGAGAAGIAALKHLEAANWYGVQKKAIVGVVCGGNIDINLLRKITMRGLIYSGRMMRLRVNIKDRPGSLADLLEILGDAGGNILEIHHDRIFSQARYQEVDVDIDLETVNHEHQESVCAVLRKAEIGFRLLEGT